MKQHISTWRMAAIALLTAAVTGAQAQVISWNLDHNGGIGGSQQAGVVLAPNWNNSWPSNPTVDLMDSTGAASTLDLAYASFNTWSIQGGAPGQDADGSYNRNLVNGYLNSGPAGWGPPITNSYVSLSQIPYAQYDVYVYFSSDAAGRNGLVTDGTTSFSFSTLGAASVSGANALLVPTTDIANGNPGANYAVFSGLTGSSQTLTVNPTSGNDQWLGIAGFQVVAVPEPSTLALGAIGLMIVGASRRSRQS
jgi:hypothetical protein